MAHALLHPNLKNGLHKGNPNFSGGTLVCKCKTNPVKVKISKGIAHNHACGCTKCWKPEGALFSIVAVAPTESVKVTDQEQKLKVVDSSALILRHACKDCGTHMHGPVEKDHAFKGLSFIHPELFENKEWPEPGFAAFVSSIIESGVNPEDMNGIRSELQKIGLQTYDCLSPALMDFLATWTAKKNGVLK